MSYRNNIPVILNSNKNFTYQVIDWVAYDINVETDDFNSDSSDNNENKNVLQQQEYVIRAYGITKKGNSVCVHINNFQPYFFIKVPDYWENKQMKSLINRLKYKVYYKSKESLVRSELLKAEDYIGFSNNKKYKFIKLVFKNYGGMRSYRYLLDKSIKIPSISSKTEFKFKQYESNIEPFLRFIHIRDLNPVGWLKLYKKKYKVNNPKLTTCQIDLTVDWNNVYPSNIEDIAPLIIASFDIECTSADGSFPQAKRPDDKIIQICTTVHRYGELECYYKHCVTLKKCDPIDNVDIDSCKTEKELLLKWQKFIKNLDPDIITGYNIWGFDLSYLHDRAELLGCKKRFMKLGRLLGQESKLIEKKLSSSAMGDNNLRYIDMEGRVQIDVFKSIQTSLVKLTSYKLDAVAKHFLGLSKVDLSPKQLFANFKTGTSDKIREIAVYCVQDCELCNRLIIKLDIIANNVGMANVCFVPFSYLFMRGQGIKIFSLVAKQCRLEGCIIPVIKKDYNKSKDTYDKKTSEDDSYEGAIVLEPKTGIYFDPVTVMDYGSLYPSSMIAENISHDTIVLDKQYDNLPDYEYNDVTYDVYSKVKKENSTKIIKVKSGKKTCRFAIRKDGKKGILPRILISLLNARKETRRRIKFKTFTMKDDNTTVNVVGSIKNETETSYIILNKSKKEIILCKKNVTNIIDTYNSFQKSILNGLQLAYKVTCNSLYGQCGASTSPICMKDLAASTTATGREALHMARDTVEEEYPGSITVYGDSVTKDTPILLREINTNKIRIMPIEQITDSWTQYEEFKSDDTKTNRQNKQQSSVRVKYEVWSNNKWTKIKRVIRHKCNKRIYRISTNTGIVDVTADHSLVNYRLKEIKVNDCKINTTKLLQSYPTFRQDKIYNTSHAIFNIDINNIPDKILNGTCQERYDYLMEYYRQNGNTFDTSDKLTASKLYYLMRSINYDSNVKYFENKYKLHSFAKNNSDNIIRKIINLEMTNDYVYDLETDDHLFQAGIGNIIVHNTDSVFVNFVPYIKEVYGNKYKDLTDKNILRITMDLSIEAAEKVTKRMKKPQYLEPEKTFYPFCLLSKKRYVGNKYEFDVNKYKQVSMGIVLKRRDNANIVKIIYGGIIDIILNKRNINLAQEFYQNSVKDLLSGKVNINDLIITKSIRAEYKDPTKIPHKVLAERMGKRDPGNKPVSNDRIPYCYIDIKCLKCIVCMRRVNIMNCKCINCCDMYCLSHLNNHRCIKRCRFCSITSVDLLGRCNTCSGNFCENHLITHKCTKINNKILQGDRIEHPKYIQECKLPIDYRYYLDHQVEKPVTQIFELTMDNPATILKDILRKDKNNHNHQNEITMWYKKKPQKTTKPKAKIKGDKLIKSIEKQMLMSAYLKNLGD